MATLTYSHPHILTTVYDNSMITEENTIVDIPALFSPYFSERGRANEIIEYNSLKDFIKEAGKPNFKKYGQAGYNIVNWLSNGGKVYGIRVPDYNATHANLVLSAKIEYAEDGSMTIKMTLDDSELSNSNLNDVKFKTIKNALIAKVNEEGTLPKDDIEIEDGAEDSFFNDNPLVNGEASLTFPLLMIYANGPGNYGNNFGIRFASENNYSRNYSFACSNLIVFEIDENGNKMESSPAICSLHPDAISTMGTNLSITNIIEKYFDGISIYFNDEAYNSLLETISEFAEVAEVEIDFNSINLLKNGDVIKDLVKVNIDELGSLLTGEGAYLAHGDNGFISEGENKRALRYEDPAVYNARNKVLAEHIFNEAEHPEIYDKKNYAFDVLLDASFSKDVKIKINDLALTRGDCIALLDTGYLGQDGIIYTDISELETEIIPEYEDYLTSLWSQSVTVLDEYTSNNIEFSPTYDLAKKIPHTEDQIGIHIPFVGPRNGIIDNCKSVNWFPNETQKEALYKNKYNYIERNYNEARFMSQQTTNKKKTALSDINHVRVLLKMTRQVEELMDGYIFSLATEETFSEININLNTILSQWVANGACKVCTGSCSQTALEAENKTAHVTVEIVFTDVLEKIIIDINVGR